MVLASFGLHYIGLIWKSLFAGGLIQNAPIFITTVGFGGIVVIATALIVVTWVCGTNIYQQLKEVFFKA